MLKNLYATIYAGLSLKGRPAGEDRLFGDHPSTFPN